MDFSKFFTQFTGRESLFILLVMLVAFLLGLLVGYLLRSRRVAQLRRELKDLKKTLAESQAEAEGLREQLALKDADIKKLGFALQEAQSVQERLEVEKEALHKDIFLLNQRISEGGSSEEQQDQLDRLNDEIARLRARNEELVQALRAETDPTDQAASMQSAYNATRQRLEYLEARVNALEQGPAQTNSRGMSSEEMSYPDVHPMPGLPDASVVEEEPELRFGGGNPMIDYIRQDPSERDELTRIEGIGSFLEQQLNQIGVFTYEEISAWDSSRIAEVTQAIGYFEGRIERDRWVEQAAQLAMQKQQSPEDFEPKPQALSENPTDLTVIEGIDSDTAKVLRSAGLVSWGDLALASVEQLQEILDASGPDFSNHDPASWPNQAKLAARGEWAMLVEYQEELRGGNS